MHPMNNASDVLQPLEMLPPMVLTAFVGTERGKEEERRNSIAGVLSVEEHHCQWCLEESTVES